MERKFVSEYKQLLKDAGEFVENKIRTEGTWIEQGIIVLKNPLCADLDLAVEENEDDHRIFTWNGRMVEPFSQYFETADILHMADRL